MFIKPLVRSRTLSTEIESCVKCGRDAKPEQYGWGWEYLDFENKEKPFHLYKCLYEGEERDTVNE